MKNHMEREKTRKSAARRICAFFLAGTMAIGSLGLPTRVHALATQYEDIEVEEVHPIEIEASSILREEGFNHSPYNMFDGDYSTCWTEGAYGIGLGETCDFYFDSSFVITGFSILPGFYKSESLFSQNGAPTEIEFRCGDHGQAFDLSFAAYEYGSGGEEGWVSYDFYDPFPMKEGGLRVTINDVREGWKYEDTCITELRFYGYYDGGYHDLETGIGEITEDQVEALGYLAYIIYISDSDWIHPQSKTIELGDVNDEAKMSSLFWYAYTQDDLRFWVDPAYPEWMAADYDDLKQMMEDIFAGEDEIAWDYFEYRHLRAVEGDVAHVAFGPWSLEDVNPGMLRFSDYTYDGTYGSAIQISGNVRVYDEEGDYYYPATRFHAYFMRSGAQTLGGWHFAWLEVE